MFLGCSRLSATVVLRGGPHGSRTGPRAAACVGAHLVNHWSVSSADFDAATVTRKMLQHIDTVTTHFQRGDRGYLLRPFLAPCGVPGAADRCAGRPCCRPRPWRSAGCDRHACTMSSALNSSIAAWTPGNTARAPAPARAHARLFWVENTPTEHRVLPSMLLPMQPTSQRAKARD